MLTPALALGVLGQSPLALNTVLFLNKADLMQKKLPQHLVSLGDRPSGHDLVSKCESLFHALGE